MPGYRHGVHVINVFCHESSIHCPGLLKNPSSYQLFDPEIVGGKEFEFIIGYHSGFAGISHALKLQGISISKTQVKKNLSRVWRESFMISIA
jgi:homocitrate synthase NifV